MFPDFLLCPGRYESLQMIQEYNSALKGQKSEHKMNEYTCMLNIPTPTHQQNKKEREKRQNRK